MRSALLLIALVSIVSADYIVALSKECEGFFCETQHLAIITFDTGKVSYEPLKTIYPSSSADVLDQLELLSAWMPKQTFVCTVTDPSKMTTTLWTFSYLTNQSSSVSLPYANENQWTIASLIYDDVSGQLIAGYGGNLYLLNPQTGNLTFWLQVWDETKRTDLAPTSVVLWDPVNNTFAQVVMSGANQNECYYIYQVDSTGKTPVLVSKCFPQYSEGSLTNLGTFFIVRTANGFFADQLNAWGNNMQFIDPHNGKIIETVLSFVDFSGLGWFYTPDPTLFTFNAANNVVWSICSVGTESTTIRMCGVSIPDGNTFQSSPIQVSDPEWTNFQAVYDI